MANAFPEDHPQFLGRGGGFVPSGPAYSLEDYVLTTYGAVLLGVLLSLAGVLFWGVTRVVLKEGLSSEGTRRSERWIVRWALLLLAALYWIVLALTLITVLVLISNGVFGWPRIMMH